MRQEIKILKWDSEFFHFPVAEIPKGSISSKKEWEKVRTELREFNVKLAYYRTDNAIESFPEGEYDFQFILKKLPLVKKVDKNAVLHPKVSLYKKDYPERNLIELAQLAGRMGRFGKDKAITIEQCDEIFKSLIINSIKKIAASHVLVYKEKDEIVGFCNIQIKKEKNEAYVPLIAVKKQYEGTGASFALMNGVEKILFDEGIKTVIGGTQDFNIQAVKSFERYGLTVEEPEYVYHLWRK